MKIIHISKLNKKTNIYNGVIEKPRGIYDTVIDAFEDQNTTQEMIADLQEEEMEKILAQEALEEGIENSIYLEINPEDLTESDLRISDALSLGKDIKIGYYTYNSNIYIERTIEPQYIYYAKTTGNNVLVSWCYDWDDYRAFILDNIVLVEDINDQKDIG